MRMISLVTAVAAVCLMVVALAPVPAGAGCGWGCGLGSDAAPPPMACGAAPFGYGPNCCETRDYCAERIWAGYCERKAGGPSRHAVIRPRGGWVAAPAAEAACCGEPASPTPAPQSPTTRGDPPAPTTSPQPVPPKTTWRLDPTRPR